MLVGVRFYVDSRLWHIWCDGGNKTYFVWIFRMLFRVNHLLCLCLCMCLRCVFHHLMCVLKQRFSLCELQITYIHFFLVRLYMNRIIIYFNLNVFTVHVECFSILRSYFYLSANCTVSVRKHTQAQCTQGMLIYRQFRSWYLFYSRNCFHCCYFCAYIHLFFVTNLCFSGFIWLVSL